MKVSKNGLKKLIKECLVEILAEDFIENLVEKKLVESTQYSQQQQSAPRRQQNRQITEDVSREFLSNIRNTEPQPIKTDITNNPLINEMLADTARTTLPKMLSEERKASGGTYTGSSTENYNDIPDGNSRWADVAFSAPKRPGH